IGTLIVRQLHLLFHDADDLEGLPLDVNRRADRWNCAEQLALHFASDEGDAAPQTDVLFFEKAPAGLRRFAPHLAVARRDAANEMARLPVAVDDRRVEEELGAHVLDERQLADREHIVRRHAHALARALAAGLQAGLAGPDDDRAVRKGAAETGV